MPKLGISIYPEIAGKAKTIAYLDLAHKYGFRRVFANLLEFKNDQAGQEKLAMLQEVYEYAKKQDFEVIVDVNPGFYKEFNIAQDDLSFFQNLKIAGIRLDEDFKGKLEAKLTNNQTNFKIELNASASTKTIDATLKQGGNPHNLIACHNFYPMRYTGLSFARFMQLSAHFQALKIRVAAFVTLPEKQKAIGPWNVNEGMPTLERHRDLPLAEQVQDLLSLNVIDDIIIAQQGATAEQLKAVAEVLTKYQKLIEDTEITLKVKVKETISKLEQDILLQNHGHEHFNRPDYNDYFVRSTFSRIYYRDQVIAPSQAGKTLLPGDVVILNKNLGRYQGEVHIITKKLVDYNKARNLVGHLQPEEQFKLSALKEGKKFKIININ